eukprot:s171_g5.t1
MLILHVDDLLLGANMQDAEADALVQRLRTCFDFGKWQCLNNDKPLVYYGGHMNKTEDGLSLDFEAYLKKVLPITVAKGRGKDQSLVCTKSVADLKLTTRPVCSTWNDMCLLCFSDAVVQVRADSSSQGGFVIILTSTKVLEGKTVPYSIEAWRSYKLPRICRSSLSAEAQSFATTLDNLVLVKTMLALIRDPDADPRHANTAADICASAIVIDAKASSTRSTKMASEARQTNALG